MEQLKADLEATRAGLTEVKDELAQRPTRKQFNIVVGAAVVVAIIVCVGAFFAVRSASSSGEAKGAAEAARTASQAARDNGEEVRLGFSITACRAAINADTVTNAQQALDTAIQDRASAIQKRDNLTIEALQYLAIQDEEGVKRVALQAPAARNMVTWTDAIVNAKVEEVATARKKYQAAIDRSISDPEGFEKECKSRGN